MKKTLILLLVAWILSAATALGEGASSFSEEKTVFTESEFSVQLPQGWVIHEADREMQEAGVFFVASSPDGECTLQIAFSALDGVVADNTELAAQIEEAFGNAEEITRGDIDFTAATLEQDMRLLRPPLTWITRVVHVLFTPADEAHAELCERVFRGLNAWNPKRRTNCTGKKELDVHQAPFSFLRA